jgi:TPR repeat protein
MIPDMKNTLIKNGLGLLLIAGMLVLSACATTTSKTHQGIDQEKQAALYQEARQLFLDGHYKDAAAILMPLAQQGHPGAQYSVGYMYHYGYGLPHNEREANHWISIAAARGNAKAKEALELLQTHYQKQPLPN